MSKTLTITDIQPQKRRKDRFNVYINGEFWSGVEAELLLKYRLKPNVTMTQEQLDLILKTDVLQSARNSAFNLISAAPKSEARLREKLTAYGYSVEIIDETITFLKGYNLVNDAELALGRAKSMAMGSKPKGPNAAREKLRKAQVAKDVVETAIQTAFDQVDLVENAVTFIRTKALRIMERPSERKRERLMASYQRKGYSPESAKRAASRDLAKKNEESLVSTLVRNGYTPAVAWAAVKQVLGALSEDDLDMLFM